LIHGDAFLAYGGEKRNFRVAKTRTCFHESSAGLGSRASSNEIIFTQGSFLQTNNPLDLVIEGRGFFQVRRPTGEIAYTRAGQFQLNPDGFRVPGPGAPN